jgi:PEP-CTERM motif
MSKVARFRSALLLGVASTIILQSPSHAIPITYVEQATATGILGGVNFTSANVILSMTSETTTVTSAPPTYFNFGTLTVNVAGIGLATFINPSAIAANQTALDVGFGDATTGSAILFTSNPLLSTYDLKTAFGPLLGTASFNAGLSFRTTDGLFVLNDVSGLVSFVSATGVPEPSSFALLSVGLAGLMGLGLGRRKAKKRVSLQYQLRRV